MSQWNPDDYRQHSSRQQKWAREILAKLALKGHEHILDIGCGDGKVTAEVAQFVPHGLVLGLDSTEVSVTNDPRTDDRATIPLSYALTATLDSFDHKSGDLDARIDR